MIDQCDSCKRERTPGGGHIIEGQLLCGGCFDGVYGRSECPRCHQTRAVSRDDTVCIVCRYLEHEPQGDVVRLFEPAPAVMPGQLAL